MLAWLLNGCVRTMGAEGNGGEPEITIDRPLPGGGVIHEVADHEIDAQPIFDQFRHDLAQVRRAKLSPTETEAAEIVLFKNLGSAGEGVVHSLLPQIKHDLI